jgi:glycerol-3-phosphate acyltransferase PlsX
VLKAPLMDIKERINPDKYGGAPLLGVRGACVIGHGSSNARAVAAGIAVAAQAVRGELTEKIAAAVAQPAQVD